MSKILDVQASTWTRDDLPGYHVRYTLPDDAKVTFDGTVLSSEAKGVLSPGVPAPQTGYVSEIGQALALHPKTGAAGNLVDGVTGKVITQPENTDPLPTEWGNGAIDEQVKAMLQWQFDHPYVKNQFNIDGNDVGQPGIEPKFMFGTAGGKLRLRTDAPAPPVVPVAVVPVPKAGDMDVNLTIGAERQAAVRSEGLSTGWFRIHLVAPNLPNAKETGWIKSAEKPGSDVHQEELAVTSNGAQIFGSIGSIYASWSTNPAVKADFYVPSGASFTAAIRHADGVNVAVANDILVDVRDPA